MCYQHSLIKSEEVILHIKAIQFISWRLVEIRVSVNPYWMAGFSWEKHSRGSNGGLLWNRIDEPWKSYVPNHQWHISLHCQSSQFLCCHYFIVKSHHNLKKNFQRYPGETSLCLPKLWYIILKNFSSLFHKRFWSHFYISKYKNIST